MMLVISICFTRRSRARKACTKICIYNYEKLSDSEKTYGMLMSAIDQDIRRRRENRNLPNAIRCWEALFPMGW